MRPGGKYRRLSAWSTISNGERFGRLVVIAKLVDPCTHVLARCECGEARIVLAANLSRGATRSRGCWAKEAIRMRGRSERGALMGHQLAGAAWGVTLAALNGDGGMSIYDRQPRNVV